VSVLGNSSRCVAFGATSALQANDHDSIAGSLRSPTPDERGVDRGDVELVHRHDGRERAIASAGDPP